ncbi:hypothetical protein ACT3TD_14325, partial [Corynebacterium sp. AOP36-E1-14]
MARRRPDGHPWTSLDAPDTLDALESIEAEAILPGHGNPLNMNLGEAVRAARLLAEEAVFAD